MNLNKLNYITTKKHMIESKLPPEGSLVVGTEYMNDTVNNILVEAEHNYAWRFTRNYYEYYSKKNYLNLASNAQKFIGKRMYWYRPCDIIVVEPPFVDIHLPSGVIVCQRLIPYIGFDFPIYDKDNKWVTVVEMTEDRQTVWVEYD